MTHPTHTVAIIEDDSALRESLCEAFAGHAAWTVTGAYARAESAAAALVKSPPDAVITEIQLPGMSGIELVASLRVRCPDTRFLMVTVYEDSDRIFRALAAGASGYLLKRDIPARLIEALDDALAGGAPMSSAIARKVVQHFYQAAPKTPPDSHLTPRETETLEMLAKGLLYKEISAAMGVRIETIRFHIGNIYRKLHVHTRTEAVIKYLDGTPRNASAKEAGSKPEL